MNSAETLKRACDENSDSYRAYEQPSKKKSRTDSEEGWTCPVCFEAQFPLMGTCGHSICEICFDSITKCPVCNKERSFAKEQPNWDLASQHGITRIANRQAIKFDTSRNDIRATKDAARKLNGVLNECENPAATLDGTQIEHILSMMDDMVHICMDEVAVAYFKPINEAFSRCRKYPLKVDVSDCSARVISHLIKIIKTKYPHIHCYKMPFRKENVLCLKPSKNYVGV